MEGFVLEASRIAREKARGVWPGRVATDYLDRWAAQKPGASALVVSHLALREWISRGWYRLLGR